MGRHAMFLRCSRARGSPRMVCKNMCFPRSELRAAELWRNETEQKWNGWELCVESAFQTPYFGGEYSEDVAEHLQEIVLGNSDHAAADLHVLYDTQNEVILGSGLTYHRE